MSGVIGAAANDGNPIVGVAWNVRLMACKFIAANRFGSTADAIRSIDFAVENGEWRSNPQLQLGRLWFLASSVGFHRPGGGARGPGRGFRGK
jgi:hypothetical protein